MNGAQLFQVEREMVNSYTSLRTSLRILLSKLSQLLEIRSIIEMVSTDFRRLLEEKCVKLEKDIQLRQKFNEKLEKRVDRLNKMVKRAGTKNTF